MNITVKEGKAEDVEIISDLIAKLLEEFNAVNGGLFNIDRKKLKNVASDLLLRKNYAVFLAIRGAIPVGIITISPAFAIYNGGDFGIITEFYVEPEFRSNGVGESLLSAALGFAKEKAFTKMEVGAPMKEQWPKSFNFYINNGFKEKGPKLRLDL